MSSGAEVESGWNPGREGVQHFSLLSPSKSLSEAPTPPSASFVLLVEDNFADVGLVREALEEHGVACELMVISDGDRAIRFIQAVDAEEAPCPDLVIVDLNLPKRPGRDVLQSIRQSAKCSAAAVVVLSSSDAPRDVTDALELGASKYVRKPLHLEEFLALGAVFKGMLEAPQNHST